MKMKRRKKTKSRQFQSNGPLKAMSARRLYPIASALALMALVCVLPASAESLTSKQFIESLGEETIGAITNPDVSEELRLTEFERLFRKGFDVKTISRFVLGRYWRAATPQQREEYQVLFADFIVQTYANRFRQYSGEKLLVDGEREASKRDTIVSSQISAPDGPAVRVDWRVRAKDDGHKIGEREASKRDTIVSSQISAPDGNA